MSDIVDRLHSLEARNKLWQREIAWLRSKREQVRRVAMALEQAAEWEGRAEEEQAKVADANAKVLSEANQVLTFCQATLTRLQQAVQGSDDLPNPDEVNSAIAAAESALHEAVESLPHKAPAGELGISKVDFVRKVDEPKGSPLLRTEVEAFAEEINHPYTLWED